MAYFFVLCALNRNFAANLVIVSSEKMKRIVLAIVLACSLFTTQAQDKTFKPFNHLDFGVTLGTTGIGFDVQMPIHEIVKLRTGFEVAPHFNYNMDFYMQSFDDQGAPTGSMFDRMSEVLYGLTGFKVDQYVTMKSNPTMWNFKFLVDVYPFKNKHWHVTAGFHWGPSKIAETVNAQEDSPSLFAAGMYNHLYDVAYKDWVEGIPTPIINTETTGAIYLDPQIEKQMVNMGRMGIPLGKFTHDMVDANGKEHKQGDIYFMEPNEYSMVFADIRTNNFKPYLGFGYEGRLIKGNDNYHIGFDAGIMFWGGTPSIMTHEGINLAKDVEDIGKEWEHNDNSEYFGNKVASYVDFITTFKAYPVINLRITRTIF